MAVIKYQEAFEKAQYRVGDQLREIINEAQVVAASLPRPHKVFLKQMRLDYDIPSATSEQPSNTFSSTVEDWQIGL